MADTGVQAFTAANNTNLNTLGWTADSGAITVQSNIATTTNGEVYVRYRYTATEMASANHYVQAERISGSPAITARQASSADTEYALNIHGTYDISYLYKYVTGTKTELDSWTRLAESGETWKLEVNGSVQNGYHEGVLVLEGTDIAITTGTFAGIRGNVYASEGLDDWSAADLAAGPYNESRAGALDQAGEYSRHLNMLRIESGDL